MISRKELRNKFSSYQLKARVRPIFLACHQAILLPLHTRTNFNAYKHSTRNMDFRVKHVDRDVKVFATAYGYLP